MLLSETAILRWNSKIKKRYVELGYEYTKMGDPFEIKVSDLMEYSAVEVEVQCDYCGKVYKKTWYRYLQENKKGNTHKDACISCRTKKAIETNYEKYGVKSVFSLESVKESTKKTNMEKYGAENPFGSDEIKEKIRLTNIQKYGVPSPLQNQEILDKVKHTCEERYGVPYYIMTHCGTGPDNPKWKGGVAYHRVERSCNEYYQWRKSVFQRDRYTCQCCGDKTGNGHAVELHSHHVKNWVDYPDERYDVDNGITLCATCHYAFHSMFGKRHNNKEQLEEFLVCQGKKVC